MAKMAAEQLEARRRKQDWKRRDELKKEILAAIKHKPLDHVREVLNDLLREAAHQWSQDRFPMIFVQK